MAGNVHRCAWAQGELYEQYHDTEWGVPCHDDQMLFEMLVLEGAQAGLSWITILKKREAYRNAFDGFNARKMAAYSAKKVKSLLADQGIVRNRLKIKAAITNAKCFLETQKEFGTFDRYIWQFTHGKVVKNAFASVKQIPATSAASDAMSKDLKKRGFSFVGSTICYAYMQSVGMVNDHIVDCFRYTAVARAKRGKRT